MSEQISLSTLMFTKPGPGNTKACLKAASDFETVAGQIGSFDQE